MTSTNTAEVDAIKRRHAVATEHLREVERELAAEHVRDHTGHPYDPETGEPHYHASDPAAWAVLVVEYAVIQRLEEELIAAMDLRAGRTRNAAGGRPCVVCGRALGVTARADAQTCSSSCRSKLFRRQGGRR